MNKKYLIVGCIFAMLIKPVLEALIPGSACCNLIMCIITALVFLYDQYVPVILIGTVFSLVEDTIYDYYTGPGALALIVVCIGIIIAKEFFNHENYVNAIVVFVVSSWLYFTVKWTIYHFIGLPYTYGFAIKSLPGNLILNVIISMLIYAVLLRQVKQSRTDRYYK